MNNREIFQKNLNDLLASSGMMQKDLAEFVGAKTTTVSGWTRGVSYPRADAMEKIAQFFGVPTSRLVGAEDLSASRPESPDIDPEIHIVSGMMETMTKEQKQQVIDLVRILMKNQK